jgi:hypothetical protein
LAGFMWIGFNWLRIGTGGELLWMQWWTFRFLRHRVNRSVIHNLYVNFLTMAFSNMNDTNVLCFTLV